VAALDAWSGQTKDRRRRDWARAVARRADRGGEWGRRLRASWDDQAALERLAGEAHLARLSPHLLAALAGALGNRREAVSLLRREQAQYPDDFWLTFTLANKLHFEQQQAAESVEFYRAALALKPCTPAVLVNLGIALADRKKLAQARDCYRRALALDPGFVYAHYNLGLALESKGQLDGAIASYRKAVEIDPNLAEGHVNLGRALQARGRLGPAIACYKKAISLDPKLVIAHNNLGLALRKKGDLEGALASLKKAVALDRKHADAHLNLGGALLQKGDLEGALASLRRALALAPKKALTHYSLGVALDANKDREGAIACYRRALALDPKLAEAHNNLGKALADKRQVKEAIACYQRAIALDPKLVQPRHNLGNIWLAARDWDRAADCYRKAIAADPNHAKSHCNLGSALMQRGDFAEALGAYRRGHALGSKRGDWKYDSGAWVRDCQRMIGREKKLLAVLAGKAAAAGAGELAEYADLCAWTRRYAAAARLWGEAFAAQAKLADDVKAGRRYQAATAAVLAAAGKGRDAGALGEGQKADLRKKALAWLKADLAAWRSHEEGSQRTRALRIWRADKALAGVRDAKGLAKLPAAERAAWGEFWAEVEKLNRPPG
jgi:tetratricopeptide (TPR) repeat protein